MIVYVLVYLKLIKMNINPSCAISVLHILVWLMSEEFNRGNLSSYYLTKSILLFFTFSRCLSVEALASMQTARKLWCFC